MQEVVSLTQDLIRFKTMHSRPDAIAQCIVFIEDYLRQNGLVFTRIEHNGYPSLLVMPGDDPTVEVLLMAHIDVVDAADAQFEPQIRDGRLYGRGAVDDKYAAALCLVLAKNHLARLEARGRSQRDLPFGVLITSDEEVGGYDGVGRVVESVKPGFCIALDGGTPQKIVVKEKGLLTLRMIAGGKAAHGSRPWLGENAVDNLIADYARLKTQFETPVAGLWCKTMNLSVIRAGSSFNQVPDRAEAVFDIRYTENEDPDRLFDALQAAVRSSKLEVIHKEPMFIGGRSRHLDRLLELAPDAEAGFEHGASDARFFSDKGVSGIVWGASGDYSAHAADEHVNIDSITAIHDVLDRFLGEL